MCRRVNLATLESQQWLRVCSNSKINRPDDKFSLLTESISLPGSNEGTNDSHSNNNIAAAGAVDQKLLYIE